MPPTFDATSNVAASAGDLSWTHTPVGTPRGILVLIVQNAVTGAPADQVSGVTYGGSSLTEAPLSPFATSGDERGEIYAYFLGSSVPTGAQTVGVTTTGVQVKRAVAITLTASSDLQVEDTTTASAISLSALLNLTTGAGVETFCAGALFSAANAVATVDTSGYTAILTHDYGSQIAAWQRRTTNATGGTVSLGYDSHGVNAEFGLFGIAIKASAAAVQNLTNGGAIASAETFGTGLVGYRQDLTTGGGIASGQAFGTGLILQGLINGGGITSAEAFGVGLIATGLTNGGVIPSAEAFGVGALSYIQFLTGGGGIPSGEAFGIGTLSFVQSLSGGGVLASGEVFGVGAVSLLGRLTNGGAIASGQVFGVGSLGFGLIGGGSIPSSEVFGIGSLQYNQIINGGAIVSGEAFGFGLIQKKTDLTVYYQTADTKYSAALAFPKPTGTVPLNAPPDDGNTTELVIRMLLTAYRAPSRNPTINTITNIPLIDELSNVAYGGITLSQGVQGFAKVVLEGHIDTPSTESAKFNQPDLIIDGFKMTYGEFIVSAIEGRVAALNGVWRRTGPTWFRDPYGRVFNNPTVIDFTGNYVEGVPGRINFNATFALPNPVHT